MDAPSTSGQGLAARAALPAKRGEIMAAMARVLESHLGALDGEDADARREHAAYESLGRQHNDLAAHLGALAEEMAGYGDLPMSAHDEAVLVSPRAVDA